MIPYIHPRSTHRSTHRSIDRSMRGIDRSHAPSMRAIDGYAGDDRSMGRTIDGEIQARHTTTRATRRTSSDGARARRDGWEETAGGGSATVRRAMRGDGWMRGTTREFARGVGHWDLGGSNAFRRVRARWRARGRAARGCVLTIGVRSPRRRARGGGVG